MFLPAVDSNKHIHTILIIQLPASLAQSVEHWTFNQ